MSNNKYLKNMTQGSEAKLILFFALPLLAGNLFQQLYNIADSAIVGQFLGYNSLAAVGATGSITFLFYTLCNGFSIGAGILIAQNFGAENHNEVKKYITNSAYALGALGVFMSVISTVLARPLLTLLDTPANIINDSVIYMQIACMGTIAVAAYNWINSVLRALGDSKTPLYFLVVASVLNIGLDLLFVLVFSMGVGGAALATVISQAVSAIGSIIFAVKKNPYFRLTKDDFRFQRFYILRCIKISVPIALQNAMISVSMIFLQKTANSFQEIVMAAYTATMRVEQLIHQPFLSLNAALSTFAGQNAGAGQYDRVKRGYIRSITMSSVFALAMMGIFMLCSNFIVGIFVDEAQVIETGAKALIISSCFYIPLGFIHVTRGLLNGVGDVGFAFINGLAEVIGRIGFAIILVNFTSLGHWSIWITTCLTWTIAGIMCVLRYRFGGWRKNIGTLTTSERTAENEQ